MNSNKSAQHQNFYSFLHKRMRFPKDDIKTYDKEGNEKILQKKFEIYDIRVDRLKKEKEKVVEIKILDEFSKYWIDDNFCSQLLDRLRKNAEILTKNNFKEIILKPDNRLCVGLGSGSVYETNITLHHIYGIPYIPASAIKGVVRSYAIYKYFNNLEHEAFKNQIMCDIFGCPEHFEFDGQKIKTYYAKEMAGDVIFFDAFPTKSPKGHIEPDVMNPHYPKYYTGEEPPADTQNPRPIFFLTVKDLPFKFIIGLSLGVKNREVDFPQKNTKKLLDLTEDLLHEALTQHGIGAKTALGYGLFLRKNSKNTTNE